jgi:uncharacterized membrane protein
MGSTIFVIAVVLLILDIFYINYVIIPSGFSKMIENIQGSPIRLNIVGALLSYLAIILGLYYFIISRQGTILDAFILGLVMYGVYDATNIATIKKWDPTVSIIDTLWGATLFSLTTMIVYSFNNTPIFFY